MAAMAVNCLPLCWDSYVLRTLGFDTGWRLVFDTHTRTHACNIVCQQHYVITLCVNNTVYQQHCVFHTNPSVHSAVHPALLSLNRGAGVGACPSCLWARGEEVPEQQYAERIISCKP